MLPIYLTEEELIGIYLCVIDSDSSSSDEYEDESADENERTIGGAPTKSSIDSKKHDWKPESWAEDSSDLHAR